MSDNVAIVLSISLCVLGLLAFTFILANKEVFPKPSEVFTTECAERGGSAATREGFEDGIHVKDYKCKGVK